MDSYPSFASLCDYMTRVAEAVPHLVSLYTIGESPEGRPLMLAEVTNQGTGPADRKPALWVDGNACGSGLAASVAALALLQRLAADHGRDELVTWLLDTRAFYLLPRMAPDGAEHCLATGEVVGSGRRPAVAQGRRDGLVPGDVNGDGRILQMRIEDPRGQWKASRRDPRLLLRRAPDDRQGPFYRLYREGFLEGSPGGSVGLGCRGLDRDLTRNFPGPANPSALSEPESRAVAGFLRSRPNVGVGLSLRDSEGRVFTPHLGSAPEEDRTLLRLVGQRAAEITGSPLVDDSAPGDLVDWMYGELGLVCLRSSLWSLPRMAGLEHCPVDPSEGELLAILRWLDRERGGSGFRPWTLCQHPQLGPVEVGGWDLVNTWLNPPPGEPLAEQCRRNVELALSLAGCLPHLVAGGREEQVGWADAREGADEDLAIPVPLRKIVLEICNEGYLPTWITQAARDEAAPVTVEVTPPAGGDLVVGPQRLELPPLGGTASVHVLAGSQAAWFGGWQEGRHQELEWLVRGDGEVALRVLHPRAGALQVQTTGEEAPAAPPPPPAYEMPRSPAPPPQPQAAGVPPRPAVGAAPVRPPAVESGFGAAPTSGYRPAARLPHLSGETRAVPGAEGAVPATHRQPLPQTAPPPPPQTPSGSPPQAAPAPPPQAPPFVAGMPTTTVREDSPLRKEGTGRVLGETSTGRVLGSPPSRAAGRPGSVARSMEEELVALVPSAPAEPRPQPGLRQSGGPAESAPAAAPPPEEDLEAPPSASRIPAPLLLRRPRQPEVKGP